MNDNVNVTIINTLVYIKVLFFVAAKRTIYEFFFDKMLWEETENNF